MKTPSLEELLNDLRGDARRFGAEDAITYIQGTIARTRQPNTAEEYWALAKLFKTLTGEKPTPAQIVMMTYQPR
jgi:hypothetical protein